MRGERFEMAGWEASKEGPEVTFYFRCSRFGTFRETVSFPSLSGGLLSRLDPELSNLLSLLQIALGVSYYKCAAAKEIMLPPTNAPDTASSLATSLYTEGLAEFYIRANLPYPIEISIQSTQAPMKSPPRATYTDYRHQDEALVAYGGGKDSYVAEAIVNKAGVEPRICSVVMSEKVARAIQRTSARPVLFLQRKLDPKIREVNQEGAFNGHVPITAINSLMLVIYGRLTAAKFVIFANERSADEPTIVTADYSANHQYSKSSFFEKILRDAISEADPAAPDYFSILRPFSEIWIARAFADLNYPFTTFTSCNRNFQISGEQSERWCGKCAKCAFTSLLLAPFLNIDEMVKIFPENFLNKPALLPFYRELCGLTEQKPWDCVGTISECRAALFKASQKADWQDTLACRMLMPDILNQHTRVTLDAMWQESLTKAERHFVPDMFLKVTDDFA